MKAAGSGEQAETAVCHYLEDRHFKVLDRNWRTKNCEIDIVVDKDGIIYFVEVKFRANEAQGDGLDYITSKKLDQMKFAAGVWCASNNWEGDYRLLAASVNGVHFEKIQIIEI